MLATKPSTADSWYKYINDTVNVNNKDGYADGVKTVDYDAILKNLASAKTTADQVAIWQSFLRDIANGTGVYAGQKDAVIKQAKAKYGTAFAQWMKDASIPTAIQDIYTNEPLAKLPDYMQGYLAVNPYDDISKANYTTTLNNQLGTLTDSKGNKLLTPGYISSVASGNPGFFNDLASKVDTAAYDAATKQLGTSAPNLSSAERASFIKDFLYNPDKINAVLHPADTGTKTDNTGTKTDNTGTSTPSGLTSLINPKLLDAQGNYRPFLSTWTAPKQGVASTNSIYSGLLDAMLNKVTGANYGTPETNKTYDALTSALTQGAGVNSLSKPKVTYDANNSAGITGLGVDFTGRTLTPLNTQVTSSPSYNPNQIANAKTAIENAQDIVNTVKSGAGTDTVKSEAGVDTLTAGKSTTPKYTFDAGDYIRPETRARTELQTAALSDPKVKAQLEWSATQDATRNLGKVSPTSISQSPAGYTYSADDVANKDAERRGQILAGVPVTIAVPTVGSQMSAEDIANRDAEARATALYQKMQADKSPINSGIVTPNITSAISPQAMNSNTGGIPSVLTSPQFNAGDYIRPETRATYANNPALANQIAWSAAQDAAKAPVVNQAVTTPVQTPAGAIANLPAATSAAPLTFQQAVAAGNPISYNPADYSPEVKAALAARAASMGQ